jgi:hypothetical protein
MSAVALTCAETPLAWPTGFAMDDLNVCNNCGIKVYAPNAGSLQILTRRQGGGVGDGVNIEESNSVGADYRGQRYSLDEAVMHVPGIHIFPGQDKVYPAEYHIHMTTYSKPERSITIVIPVSHRVTGPGQDYFASMAARPDASAVRPTLQTLLTPGTTVIQYQGPDIRGRTLDVPTPTAQCSSNAERQFLLVTQVMQIRATDLERIPREGSISTDPRDLPAPGVASTKKLARDRMIESITIAKPGILDPNAPEKEPTILHTPAAAEEMECRPLKVVDGVDVIDMSGNAIDIRTLLGLPGGKGLMGAVLKPMGDVPADTTAPKWMTFSVNFVGTFLGIVFADYIFSYIWSFFFESSEGRLEKWTVIKLLFMLGVSLSTAAYGSFLDRGEEDDIGNNDQ